MRATVACVLVQRNIGVARAEGLSIPLIVEDAVNNACTTATIGARWRVPAPGVVLAMLLAACGAAPPPPLATTVCGLAAHAQRTVQLTASVSVDASGTALISDPACAGTRIELRLSAAGSRAGAAERLQSAAKAAVGAGKTSFSVGLTGVYNSTPEGAVFIADSVAPSP
jgi:hypothetical protein